MYLSKELFTYDNIKLDVYMIPVIYETIYVIIYLITYPIKKVLQMEAPFLNRKRWQDLIPESSTKNTAKYVVSWMRHKLTD